MNLRIKNVMIVFLSFMLVTLLLACSGSSYICEQCGQSSSGKAYYVMCGKEVMCEGCARSYWLPLDYRNFQWDRVPDYAMAEGRSAAANQSSAVSENEEAYDEDDSNADMLLFINETMNNLNSFDATDDIAGAINYLNTRIELLKITYGINDAELDDQLIAYKDTYKKQLLTDAQEAFQSSGYAEALRILNEGIATLGETNDDIQQAMDYYDSFGPTWLVDLDYFALDQGNCEANFSFDSGREKDNEGVTHKHTLVFEPGGSEIGGITYLLDGKFSTFSGTIYLTADTKNTRGTMTVAFYGDGQLLYTSPTFTSGVRTATFSVDITDVSMLRMVAEQIDAFTAVGLGEALLEP